MKVGKGAHRGETAQFNRVAIGGSEGQRRLRIESVDMPPHMRVHGGFCAIALAPVLCALHVTSEMLLAVRVKQVGGVDAVLSSSLCLATLHVLSRFSPTIPTANPHRVIDRPLSVVCREKLIRCINR
jgi:hypothetical protein